MTREPFRHHDEGCHGGSQDIDTLRSCREYYTLDGWNIKAPDRIPLVVAGTGVCTDWIVKADGVRTAGTYPERLRRIRFHEAETQQNLVLITNDFLLPAQVSAALSKARWQIELFFKWVK
jgi:IS4 transposase